MKPADLPGAPALEDLEDLAADLAAGAGALALAGRRQELRIGTKSSDTDLVTHMDRRVQEYLMRRIRLERPGDGVLGEEDGARVRPGTTGLTWVVDPIDGTVNYVYGRPEYAVSVAVVTGDVTSPGAWAPLAAAVCAPEPGQLFRARAGAGAYLSDQAGHRRRLSVSACSQAGQALIATGFGYEPQVRAAQGRVVAGLLPQIRDLRRGGSAALDLCAVAAGYADGYFERGVNVWDVAAGMLIAAEAGAVITGISSPPPLADGILAAGPGVHGALRELLAGACSCAGGHAGNHRNM